ncbi:unnamed protein product, partial [Laminaria digitata]
GEGVPGAKGDCGGGPRFYQGRPGGVRRAGHRGRVLVPVRRRRRRLRTGPTEPHLSTEAGEELRRARRRHERRRGQRERRQGGLLGDGVDAVRPVLAAVPS